MPPQLKYASRYKRGDDEDGDDGQILMQQASSGPPAICMVFPLPNEDESDELDIALVKLEREKIVSRLRNLGFDIDQMVNQAGDKIFLKIRLSKEGLFRQATERKIKVRLEKGAPGAFVEFDERLYNKKVFREPADGHDVFSSLQQLEMADHVLRSEPFQDGTDEVERLVPERMLNDPVENTASDEKFPKLLGYYFLHDSLFLYRAKLLQEWVTAYFKPQPLHMVQTYFGEKIAIYFTWLGYYNSMLWLPALGGAIFSSTQESESPYVLTFCIALVAWAVLFNHLWKRLETRLTYEYDTLDFEHSEELRYEFTIHKFTEKGKYRNPINGQIEDFHMDEGTFLPWPTGRAARVLISYSFVAAFCLLAIALNLLAYKYIGLSLLTPEDPTTGGVVLGVTFAAINAGLQHLFDHLFTDCIEAENWPTETKHEDALILRSCAFRIVCNYFGPFLVLALADNLYLPGGPDLSCPDRQCLAPLRAIVPSQYISLMLLRQLSRRVVPWALAFGRQWYSEAGNQRRNKNKKKAVLKFPMEEELEYQDFPGLPYGQFVYQFGWVALFGAAFPWIAALALAAGLVELRFDAYELVMRTKRPRYMCAQDIGSWATVINVLAMLSVVTNALFAGLTTHTLYFYFPSMTPVQRLWGVAILEHLLYLIKVLIEMFLPTEGAAEQEEFEGRQCSMRNLVAEWLDKDKGGGKDDLD